MGKKANPTLIGAFVVGAVVLTVTGILVFGSGRLFRTTYPFVLYFDSNVNGLRIGAPVKFKGVEIGSVTQIRLRLDQSERDTHIPVLVEIDDDKLKSAGVTGDFGDRRVMAKAVELGLRGRLEMESFVTGVLYVYLDYYPDTAANLVAQSGQLQEIPTLPTQLEQVQNAVREVLNRLDKIDFHGLVEQLTHTADAISGLARSSEIRTALDSLNQTMGSIRQFADTLNANVGPLAQSVVGTAQSLQATAERTLAVEAELRDTLRNVKTLVDPASPLAYELKDALQSLGQASQAVRILADYLQRNPNAIVVGRPPERSTP
ncbi:MAG: MlaD family protein [bacterium]